jgi:hypothetical protein
MNPLKNATSETIPTLLNFPPPVYLKHKPIFMLPYEAFDGHYAGQTDAKYLSIGLAQWRNDDDPTPISAKVWRYPDGKWSRMNEELPIHRIIDLCIFLTVTLFGGETTAPIFPAETFENQNEPLQLNMLEDIPEEFESERERIKERLTKLYEILRDAGIG